jgi:hypothetical protein
MMTKGSGRGPAVRCDRRNTMAKTMIGQSEDTPHLLTIRHSTLSMVRVLCDHPVPGDPLQVSKTR